MCIQNFYKLWQHFIESLLIISVDQLQNLNCLYLISTHMKYISIEHVKYFFVNLAKKLIHFLVKDVKLQKSKEICFSFSSEYNCFCKKNTLLLRLLSIQNYSYLPTRRLYAEFLPRFFIYANS